MEPPQAIEHPNGTVIMTDAPLVEVAGPVVVTGAADGAEPEPEGEMDGDLKDRTVWVGGIPGNIVGNAESAILNINANKNVKSLMTTFGPVTHSTVRGKPGVNKSWALVTFEDRWVQRRHPPFRRPAPRALLLADAFAVGITAGRVRTRRSRTGSRSWMRSAKS